MIKNARIDGDIYYHERERLLDGYLYEASHLESYLHAALAWLPSDAKQG